MSAKTKELLRQQYLLPRKSVKKVREMSRREGVSAGEIVRRAIETYTSGQARTECEEETASRDLLRDIHSHVRASLRSIDAHLAETRAREQVLADITFRANVRKETQAWLDVHPEHVGAIAALLAPEAR